MSIVDNAVIPSQQSRALWLSTIAFTLCFAVWTIFSIIGQIQKDLGLSETEFGLLARPPFVRIVNPIGAGHLERPIWRRYRLYQCHGDSGDCDFSTDNG